MHKLSKIACEYVRIGTLKPHTLYFISVDLSNEIVLDCYEDKELVMEEFTELNTYEMCQHVYKLLSKHKEKCNRIEFTGDIYNCSKLVYPFSFSDVNRIENSCVESIFAFIKVS